MLTTTCCAAGVHRFGFVKYRTRAAAGDALEKLAGKQLKDFPGQIVRAQPPVLCRPRNRKEKM